jgi:hydrogenase/urease accessory protein HupE
MGVALGAAVAGLVANASGLSAAIANQGMVRAAFWVPASFVVSAALAFLVGLRLCYLPER